ncbi:unnamed protein product [Effrenium voratum]|nr:unnamed protein product [Effrenium voratum]
MPSIIYGKQLADALGKDGKQEKDDYAKAWKVAIKAIMAMLRFKRSIARWSRKSDPRSRDAGYDHTLRGFHELPPTPLRRLAREMPPKTVELVIHGLKGELLMGPDVVALNVYVSQIKQRLLVHARNAVIKGHLSRALQLYSFIALGAVVHLLHKRRAVGNLETLKMLIQEDGHAGTGAYSPDTMATNLAGVAAKLPEENGLQSPRHGPSTLKTPLAGERGNDPPAPRIELVAVVFVHIYGLVAWGDASAGGAIPLSISERLSHGITFAVGNTRAFAAVGQSGQVTTWGDPACGGSSVSVAEHLKSRAFQICHNEWAFAAFREGGQLVCWGDPDAGGHPGEVAASLTSGVMKVCSTEFAFAALKESGQVVTWGDASVGGDSSAVQAQLQGVRSIWSNAGAFVAVKEDGSTVVWGDPGAGGVLPEAELHGIDSVYSNIRAFAAITSGGRAVAWGAPGCGGDASAVQHELEDVVDIRGNGRAFAAMKADGGVVCWGNPDFGGDASATQHMLKHSIVEVVPSLKAFAALREDPISLGYTVMTWGDAATGGDSSKVGRLLIGNVLQVVANDWAFAARRDDGLVVCWGDADSGGDASLVAEKIRAGGGASMLYKTTRAFAAVLADGSICSWGEISCGGDCTPAEVELAGAKVLDMCANDYAFCARSSTGRVVSWGHKMYGGSIDEERRRASCPAA